MEEQITIKLLDETSVDDQIKIYAESFGYRGSIDKLKEFWMEKHFNNPIDKSAIFGAYVNDELAGINAYTPMDYSYTGRVIHVVQSCESGVAVKFRRRGIWVKIVTYAMEYFKKEGKYEAVIGFPNYRNSYPGFVKMGWLTLFNEENMLMINNGPAVFGTKFPKAISWIGKLAELQKIPMSFKSKKSKYIVEKVESLKLEMENDDKISLNLSEKWFDWKIGYKNHDLYSVRDDDKIVAGFVVEKNGLDGVRYLKLIKGFNYCDDNKVYREAFIAFVEFVFKNREISLLRIWTTEMDKYKKLGFIHMKSHVNPYIVYPLNEDSRELLADPEKWSVGLLDLD